MPSTRTITGGASFKKKSESIFDDFPFRKAEVYPAPVHQYLSPNDNRLHGVAKARWRAKVTNWKDDVRNTLLLMKELDNVAQGSGSRQTCSWRRMKLPPSLQSAVSLATARNQKRNLNSLSSARKTTGTFATRTCGVTVETSRSLLGPSIVGLTAPTGTSTNSKKMAEILVKSGGFKPEKFFFFNKSFQSDTSLRRRVFKV